MSLNQRRIHPLPSQSDNNIAAPPPPPRNDHHEAGRQSDLEGIVICMISVFVIFMLVVHCVPKYFEDDHQTVLFHAVNASLTQFDLTNNNDTLDYNLTVDLNVTSPNRNFSKAIVYDEIEARAYYQGNRLDLVHLMPFYHDQKNRTTTIHTVFQGQAALLVPRLGEEYEYDSELRDRFYRDKSYGSFDIQVQFSLRVRYNYGRFIKSVDENWYWKVICGLRRIPLLNVLSSSSSNNGSSNNPTMYCWRQQQRPSRLLYYKVQS